MADRQPIPLPPAAPSTRRRLSPTRKQWIGIPMLVAVPLLALAGLFGERTAVASATSPLVGVRVAYPERLRYRQVQRLEVTVVNRSARTLDTVLVSLDTAYLTRFTDVRVAPAPSRAFVVSLADVRPGDARLVHVQLAGDRYGAHRGRVVTTAGGDSVALALRTIVFP